MATIDKKGLSASTNGKPIKILSNSPTSPTLIHATYSDAGTSTWDEIWLYAYNSSTNAVMLSIQWGGTTDEEFKISIPAQNGRMLIVAGEILQSGQSASLSITGYSSAINCIYITGYVNQYT